MNLSATAVEAAVLAFHRDNLWESALEAAYAVDSKTSDEEQRQLLDTVVRCNATIEALRAENEKLRAALKQCDEAMAWCLGGEPIDTLMIEARRAAADALKETGDETSA